MVNDILSFMYLHPEITVIGAVTLIQIAPIKIDPWTKLAKWFRGIITGDLERKIDGVSRKVDKLEANAEEDKALRARTHILRFADEVYQQERHSREYFDDILQDCDQYEKYCEKHPEFKNNKTAMSIGRIQAVYARLLETHDFL